MAKKKEKFIRTKTHCNIGTIGHVDHGKTTLTAAITKVLADLDGNTKFQKYEAIDKSPEERRRKITIQSTNVEYETSLRHYSHIDCPGHQDYIKNMIIGATQMDGVILVVSAADGVQVQTREHVILAKEIGLKYLVVFLNKVDRVPDNSMLELIELEILELLDVYGFGNSPIVRGSALDALAGVKSGVDSIKLLMDEVDSYVKVKSEERLGELFLMPIESVVVASGRGTVVTGKVERGVIRINDNLKVLTQRKVFSTQCMGIEMYHKILDEGRAGDNLGILLKNVPNRDVKRGDVLVLAEGDVKMYDEFLCHVYILLTEEGGRKTSFKSGYKPQLFFRVNNISCTILTELEDQIIMPGDDLVVRIKLDKKALVEPGLRFVIREGKITVGAGIITELC